MDPIFKRTSVRKWEDQPVSREQLETILKAGMQSPSAMNSQPWEFYVVTDPNVKRELAEMSPYSHFTAQAPVLIALAARKENSCPAYNQIDMGICIENILLETVEQGLGAVCLGVAPLQERMDAMAKILNLPDSLESSAIIALGVPAQKEIQQQDRYDPKRIHWVDK